MGLTVDNKGGDFKSIEPGSYIARCIRLIDLGTQHGEYKGQPTQKKQVMIMWELPTEVIEGGEFDGKPYTISRFYTASLSDKATLRKDLEAWRGKAFTEAELKGFSLLNILGKACMLSVIHNENGRAKISSVSSIPKGLTCSEQINPSMAFDLDSWLKNDPEQNEIFASLSEKMQALIKESDEFKQGPNIPADGDNSFNPDDSEPF